MGVPTLSVFAGRPAAVDEWLESQGRLVRLSRGDPLPEGVARRRNGVRALDDLRRRGEAIMSRFLEAIEVALKVRR